jgi:hypothetical protein
MAQSTFVCVAYIRTTPETLLETGHVVPSNPNPAESAASRKE